MKFWYYKKCSTCIKAKKYLDNLNIEYEAIEMVENPLTYKEFENFLNKGADIDKLFNTSGILYRTYNYKEKIKSMTLEEKLNDLSKNPKLVKRPILETDDKVIIGFKEELYKKV